MQSIVNTSSSVNELSAQSALDAESGNKLMKQMIQQMNIIQNSVHSGVKTSRDYERTIRRNC